MFATAAGQRAPKPEVPSRLQAAMEYFEVQGGSPLAGNIEPQGAKNEALQVLAATLLTDQPVVLDNLPDILDVQRMIELLQVLGVEANRLAANRWHFAARHVNPDCLLQPEAIRAMQRLRGSVLVIGPLLARCGAVYLPKPGGDKIGRRRIDVHLLGMEALGARFDVDPDQDFYRLFAPQGLQGAYLYPDEISVTGTANLLMAAVLANGTTTLYNVACEPYIQQLCHMLVRMGARIEGIGSNLLTVHGVSGLHGTEHRLLADMIEVGSFIGLASMTRSQLRIPNADVAQLGLMPRVFRKLGVDVQEQGNDLLVDGTRVPEIQTFLDGGILTLYDAPWPGLTPDILSVLLVTATQCRGTVLVHQKMFESRLFFTDKLIDMGAQVILCDPHRATVIGLGHQQPLRGITMSSPDIRAGVALLIAALSAQGTSRIFNIEQIDRGYERIEERLRSLGAQLTRRVEG